MKKIIGLLILLIILVMTFAGCNMSMGLGNYEYNKIHIDTYHYSGCLKVDKWYETTTGVEVKTEDGESLYLSEGTYIMVEDECPLCAAKNN